MTLLHLCLIGLLSIILIIYLLSQYVLNEKQCFQIKYRLYAGSIMAWSIVLTPVFLLRPRNASNIALSARLMNPMLRLFGIGYRLENLEILNKEGPCVIVANHQSSIDFIGMMRLWPDHVRYCTALAKKELFWMLPFGLTAWFAGLEYVDRKNRDRSRATMNHLTKKVQKKSLRLWIFPEGTRSMKDTLLPFKYGAFRLAIEAQVPIVPIVFSSYKSIYNADKVTKDYYWRGGCVTVRCLEPIETKGMTIENDLHRLTDMTRERMIDVYQKLATVTNDKKDN